MSDPTRAHARRDDPDTSHQAADAVTPDLRELQARVAAYAVSKGHEGFTDAQLSFELEDEGSTMRTRRSELTAMGIVLDSGHRRRWGESTRKRIVWVHSKFARDDARRYDATVERASVADKAEARTLGNSLVSLATGLRGRGLSAAADQIERGGKMLRRFGA